MKVVIEIDKRDYEFIKSVRSIMKNSDTFLRIATDLFKAVQDGASLPKGHGDLIDRDYFTDKYAGCGNVYCEAISCKDCNSRIVNKFDVDGAPTVIQADK